MSKLYPYYKKIIFISLPLSILIFFAFNKYQSKPKISPLINPNIVCSLDSVDGYFLKGVTFNPNDDVKSFSFSGWIASPALHLIPKKVEVLLLSPPVGRYLLFNEFNPVLRHDVSIAYNKGYLLDNSGFSITAKVNLDNNKLIYDIFILGYFDGFTGICPTDKKIIL